MRNSTNKNEMFEIVSINSPINTQEFDQTCYSCPRCDKLFFVNVATGEIVKGSCKTYSCEYCGYRKARRLQNALEDYFQKFKIIRFWTFTITDQLINHLPEDEKLKIFSELWRRFLNNVRRNPNLTKTERNFQYVKVLEFQKQGNPHFHAFFDRWVDRSEILKIWVNIIKHFYVNGLTYSIDDEILPDDILFIPEKDIKWFGGVDVRSNIEKQTGLSKWGYTSKQAASYVTKYLMKTIKEIGKAIKARVWSKSSRVRIFPLKPLPSPWILMSDAIRLLNLQSLRVTSPVENPLIELFIHNSCTLDNYIGNSS